MQALGLQVRVAPNPLSRHRLLQLFSLESAKLGRVTRREPKRENYRSARSYGVALKLFKELYADTTLNQKGYRQVYVDGKWCAAQRVIWTLVFGDIPSGVVIDHLNSVKSDNRPENLQAVSNTENRRMGSVFRKPKNGTGYYGVRYYKRFGKYAATFWSETGFITGKSKPDAEDAVIDRISLELKHWGYFSRAHSDYLDCHFDLWGWKNPACTPEAPDH